MMEIHTCLDEITDTLKMLKDAVPADFHHQDIVKQDIVSVTIETNLRQGDLETELNGTKGDVTETESNEALSEWEESRIIDFKQERSGGLRLPRWRNMNILIFHIDLGARHVCRGDHVIGSTEGSMGEINSKSLVLCSTTASLVERATKKL